MGFQDATDVRVLAERAINEAIRDEMRRSLYVARLPSGKQVLGRCKVCPLSVRDSRRYGVWAFYSSTTLGTVGDVIEWFIAHRATDLHRWYADGNGPERFPFECSTAKKWEQRRSARSGALGHPIESVLNEALDRISSDRGRES